jgi:uncharacterized protein (DUF362 family)
MNHDLSPSTEPMHRRTWLAAGGTLAAGALAAPLAWYAGRQPAPVFVARHQRYDGPLVATLRDGLLATGFDPATIAAKRVLIKPNLVEPSRLVPHMTTHPAMIVAAAEVFRAWGAEVTVGEAPGHVRDTEMALEESGVGEALRDGDLTFADLNYQPTAWCRNRGRRCQLDGFHFPRSVVEADLVVSLPKMKTHHWVGVTCSMKNFYGVLPGIKYGWPKNVLHHNGIPQTVVDINASLPSTLAIVDGIDCMEGDGPILGSRKSMGVVVVGQNLPAVDATVARMMGLVPQRIEYLSLAQGWLGPLDDGLIEQRGEAWQSVASPFHVLDEPHLQKLRAAQSGALFS